MFSKADLAPYRSTFPHLEQPHYYLNHAAFGVLSTRVNDAINLHLNARSTGPIFTFPADHEVMESARQRIAQLINAPSPDNISFVTNTSEGLNLIASGLNLGSGDRILLNTAEFPSNVYPFTNLERHGVGVDFIQSDKGFVTPDEISHALQEQHKLVSVSAVQFLSGYRIDLEKTGHIVRNNGSLFIVDAIQAIGNSPIDVQAMQIDGLVSGGLKWMMAPMGTGFVYISDKLRERIEQQYVGWLSVQTPWELSNFDQGLNPTNRRYELGGLNIPGIYALNESVVPFLELGSERIRQHLVQLTDLIQERISSLGLVQFTVNDPDRRTGIITFDLPEKIDGEQLINTLAGHRVTISHRQGKIRFSPHYYNNSDDINAAMDIFMDVIHHNAL